MGPAIIGLIGVIIGAMLSGSLTLLTKRRSDRQQARAAARLLESELRSVTQDLYLLGDSLVADTAIDPQVFLNLPPTTSWDTYRSSLAALLTNDEWYAVATAYESIEALRGAANPRFFYEGRPIHMLVGEFLQELVANVQAGTVAVSRLAGNPNRQPVPPAIRDYLKRATKAPQETPLGELCDTPACAGRTETRAGLWARSRRSGPAHVDAVGSPDGLRPRHAGPLQSRSTDGSAISSAVLFPAR
jgi:hypothetical protein